MEESQHLMNICQRSPRVMHHGSGSWLWDSAGKRYLDFVQGWAVNALGHAPAEVSAALTEQSKQLLTPSPSYATLPLLNLARELAAASEMDEVFVCNSGAEAVECAIKLARKWGRLHKGGAYKLVSAENSFHGRTLAAMAASGKPGWPELFPPNLPGFIKVPFGNLSALKAALTPDVAAVLLEPIQGEGGVNVPPPGFLAEVRALTEQNNTLLIWDEIQTGMGRTGTLFRFQAEGARPDIVVIGKGLGAGFPVAAVAARRHASVFTPGDQGGTFCGAPLSAACALAVLRVLREEALLAQVRSSGVYLAQGLATLQAHGLIRGFRGAGLLWAVELVSATGETVVAHAAEAGLLLNSPRPHQLRFMPQLRVSLSEIDQMLETLTRVLKSAQREVA